MTGERSGAPESVDEGPVGPLRVISYGGGVQSTAMIVLAVEGRLGVDIDAALFANVGDDSEHPATVRYVREVMQPWAADRGLPVHELHKRRRDGSTETLYGRLTRPGSRSLPIPVRMSNGAPGRRSCTAEFKIRVVGKWLREHGASADRPADVAIGISLDEIERATNRREDPHEQVIYPLLALGLRRTDCVRVIQRAGLAVPPKSACWFCPMHRPSVWAAMRVDEPELFDRSVELEDLLNERRAELGKDPVWFTRFNRSLRDVVPAGIQTLPLIFDQPGNSGSAVEQDSGQDGELDGGLDEGPCDSGWCAT